MLSDPLIASFCYNIAQMLMLLCTKLATDLKNPLMSDFGGTVLHPESAGFETLCFKSTCPDFSLPLHHPSQPDQTCECELHTHLAQLHIDVCVAYAHAAFLTIQMKGAG